MLKKNNDNAERKNNEDYKKLNILYMLYLLNYTVNFFKINDLF